MGWVGAMLALALIGIIFTDAFQSVILPRRVSYDFRLARFYYQGGWVAWRGAARWFPAGRKRNTFLSIFGPLSLFGLLVVWAAGLIVGFGLLHWSLGTAISVPSGSDDSLGTYLYFSGTTFFTLGYGDVVPTGAWGRVLSVTESGIGFGFLAVIIGYLPVIYQAFSRREIAISLLDARAGSPPSAGELLRRLAEAKSIDSVGPLLLAWEKWAAELLESHISFPVVSYYRSQHDNQSWVGALTTILDTSALLIAGSPGPAGYQARLTFAMARHAAVDMAMVFQTPPLSPAADRLPASGLEQLAESLRGAGLESLDGKALAELRSLYEPFVNALAGYFQFPLPDFLPAKPAVDNWQTSAWTRRSPGLGGLARAAGEDEHFD